MDIIIKVLMSLFFTPLLTSIWVMKFIVLICVLLEAIHIIKNIKFNIKLNAGKLIFKNYIFFCIVLLDFMLSDLSKGFLGMIVSKNLKDFEFKFLITVNDYVNYFILFLLCLMTMKLLFIEMKDEKIKKPYLFLKRNKNWQIKEFDVIKRFHEIKNIKFFSAENNELISINANKNPQQLFAKNLEQAFHILSIKYGKYEESWNIKICKINGSILEFHIVLKDNKEKMIKIEKYVN